MRGVEAVLLLCTNAAHPVCVFMREKGLTIMCDVDVEGTRGVAI